MKRFDIDIKHYWKELPIALAILTVGCTGDIDVNAPEDSATPLSFTLSVPAASRSLTYNGASTAFNDGAHIGCVIATKNDSGVCEYCANSCWTYVKADNSLQLEKLYGADNNSIELAGESNNILRHYNASDGLIQDYKYAVKLLKDNTEYSFHFYYPYVDTEILKDETVIKSYTYNYTDGNGQESSSVVAPIAASSRPEGESNYFAWINFPIISHVDFENTTDNTLLEVNDFMFASVDKGADGKAITSANKSGTLPVLFEKKMATVDIIFTTTDEINDVKLIMTPESGDPIKRTYLFNMSDGAPLDGTLSGLGLDNFDSYPTVDGKSTIAPRLIDKNTKTYRLILPPQSVNITVAVSFTATANSTAKSQTVEGSSLITIKGSTRYVLNVSKTSSSGDDPSTSEYKWQMKTSEGSLIEDWNTDNTIKTDVIKNS